MLRFPLDSAQCEFLVAFETVGSVVRLAELYRRDVSVLSRQLKQIASIAPGLLEKRQGKWRLTVQGKKMNLWTRDCAEKQKRILSHRHTIRIGATREFAARVIAPQLGSLQFDADGHQSEMSIITDENGVEALLLRDEIDFGFDCGRPTDPLIRFKMIKTESFGIFASPLFLRKKRIKNAEDLWPASHLHYKRAPAVRLLGLGTDLQNIRAAFNDIAVVREAAVGGEGWCVLPTYAVSRELKQGILEQIPYSGMQSEKFGVWWIRGRDTLADTIELAAQWLGRQGI